MRGSSCTWVVALAPCASVAVSRTVSWVGSVRSGAVSVPLARSASLSITVVPARSSQSSAEAGRAPCCGSVAPPLKPIAWRALHWAPAAGVVICGTGEELDAVTVTESVSETPSSSVTRRPMSWLPRP